MLLDAFMKFEEPAVAGESTDSIHTSEIEILSFEQSILRPAIASDSKAGTSDTAKARSEHKPLTVLKPLDKSSPKLYQASCAGTVYQKVSLFLCQPSGTSKTTRDRWKKIVYLEITMEGVHVSRMHIVGDPRLHHFGRSADFPIAAGEVLQMGPLEEIDLTYKKIQWLYKGGTGQMNIVGKWNLGTNNAT